MHCINTIDAIPGEQLDFAQLLLTCLGKDETDYGYCQGGGNSERGMAQQICRGFDPSVHTRDSC